MNYFNVIVGVARNANTTIRTLREYGQIREYRAPFHTVFTARVIKATKNIAKCRIHVERANARLKDFKTLSFVPPDLKYYADKVF